MEPQVSQNGQYISGPSGSNVQSANVKNVVSLASGTTLAVVDVVVLDRNDTAWTLHTSVPYVEVGGTPPASGAYVQEIQLV